VSTACLAAAVVCAPGAAQQSTVETVTVSGVKATTEVKIDRRVYRLGSDIQATTGSASDVLRNLPSVDVDVLGNVSLRGDGNVQVLIDGKPSTLLSGANLADTLQQMPADSIDSVEVITTPSAQFKPEGSAGIINIITKQNRRFGASGTATAGVGSEGRYYLGVSGSDKLRGYNIYGSLNLRQDDRKRLTSNDRATFDAGSWLGDTQAVWQQTKRFLATIAGGFDHDISKNDHVSANGSFYDRFGHPRSNEDDATTSGSGAILSSLNRQGAGYEREYSGKVSAEYIHTFGEDGHDLTLSPQYEHTIDYHRNDYTNVFAVPVQPSTMDRIQTADDELLYEVSLDYARPLPDQGKLRLGYDMEVNNDLYGHLGGSLDPVTRVLTPSAALTNDFAYSQAVHSIYGEYQRGFGDLKVKAGLRLEQVFVDTNQITTAQKSSLQYARYYPSLHLEYALADSDTLRFGYSHRVTRPDPEDMNPYPVYQDAFDFRAGNPQLMPQETHSVEAGYQLDEGSHTFLATLYYRKTFNGITDVVTYLGNNVFLSTKENLSKSQSGGLELTASGKLFEGFRYNLYGNGFYSEIDAASLGFSGAKSAFSYSGKATVDYQFLPDDRIQITGNYNGKRLTPQGYRLPTYSVNVGFRHQLPHNLAVVVTASDIFNSYRDAYQLDTPTLVGTNKRHQLGRIVYLGLTFRFGLDPSKDENGFEYSSDAP
jgi:outer membrane receptor protein involved in Fe transport